MFSTVSMTGTGVAGIAVYLVIGIGKHFGIDIAEGEAAIFAQNIVGIIAFALTIIGQMRRKDLSGGLLRK